MMDSVANSLASFLGRPVDVITSSDSIDVASYRMKRVRDHRVFSRIKREMFDANENWVIAMTLTVVRRALRGRHVVISVLISPEIVDLIKDDLVSNVVRDKIMIAPKALIDEVIGMELNNLHSAAALVNIATKHIFPEISDDLSPLSIECPLSLPPNLEMPILVMDDVRSSDNIGVICRTAFSLGIPTVLCTTTTFSGVNARSSRVSMGAIFHLDIFVTSDLPLTLKHLQKCGVTVIGTSPTAKECIRSADSSRWAVVMGNEESGASKETLEACSKVISIPQIRGDSLSVVTASAICLYELSRDSITQQRNTTEFEPDLP